MIVTSPARSKRSPARFARVAMTDGRPTSSGFASPSSMTVCTARSTRSSSPSAYTTRFGFERAASITGRMNIAVCSTKRLSERRYAPMSSIGRVATPDARAASATAGAKRRISRESNGFGMM